MDSLNPQALDQPLGFNWIFLIELLVCCIVTIFFLFYFNRVFAKIISVALRAYIRTWTGSPVYIDIQSLQVSLLAGRIFFGRVRYHGSNETIQIVSGHITWRYWLRKVRHCHGDKAKLSKTNEFPSRIKVKLNGLEWFVYNRSPAYDAIWTQMEDSVSRDQCQPPPGAGLGIDGKCPKSGLESFPDAGGSMPSQYYTQEKQPTFSVGPDEHLVPSDDLDRGIDRQAEFQMDSLFLRVLPIRIDCHKGGVVMGNNNTPTILVAKFRDADGTIDATPSRGPDYYKQVFNIHFISPVISIKENYDFKESQLSRGARIMTEQPIQTKLWTTVRDLLPLFHLSQESLVPEPPLNARNPRHDSWVGLARYFDESEEKSQFQPAEYAMVATILDAPDARMTIYWDVPGQVGLCSAEDHPVSEYAHDINGSIPPDWGIDLVIKGGTINYGPWADRQRVELQNLFFPRLYKDSIPARRLKKGSTRQSTVFQLFVELKDSMMLRIPLREESNDWKFKRRLNEGELRAFGWLDLKIGEGTISNVMAMVASQTGFLNKLQLEFKDCEVRTSVNNGLLLQADQLAFIGDVSSPLKWNGLRNWAFDIVAKCPKLFLLREHITLLTDLISDWASGPPQDYYTFSPFKYDFNLTFTDFELFLNVNDGNIINNPSDLDDNTFLILKGDELKSIAHIPIYRLRPPSMEVPFTVEVRTLKLCLHTPPWSTQASFLEVSDVASVNDFVLSAKYRYHAATSPVLTDTLTLDILGTNLGFTFHGVLIRYFLTIRENYFGENIHFKTLEEYQRKDLHHTGLGEKPTMTNGLDVILSVEANDSYLLFPAHIYSAKECIRLDLAQLGLDMRFTNLYMDLQINGSPISASFSSVDLPDDTAKGFLSPTQLFLDDLVIYGHRLFGLPPTEPTYVCNWDLLFGTFSGECTVEFLRTLLFGLRACDFSIDDVENALPPALPSILHDITFLRVRVKSVQVWLRIPPCAFLLSIDEINFTLNDWANELYSDRIFLSIPGLVLACIDEESALRQKGKQSIHSPSQLRKIKTHGYISTDVTVTVFGCKGGAAEKRKQQQQHIHDHDLRTGRADFLLQSKEERHYASASHFPSPLPMCAPSMPPPLYELPASLSSVREGSVSASSHHLSRWGRKSTFLTSHSNSSGSGLSRTASSKSPSFHSAVQTVSDTLLATPYAEESRLGSPLVSSNSQSPMRMPTPSPGRRTFGNSSHFSSSFNQPHFPLQGVKPDVTNVPTLDGTIRADDDIMYAPSAPIPEIEDNVMKNSIVFDLGQGVKAFCDLTALSNILRIVDGLQPQSTEDILDNIQITVINQLAKLTKKTSHIIKELELCVRMPQFKLRFINPLPGAVSNPLGLDGQLRDDIFNLDLTTSVITAKSKEALKNSADHYPQSSFTIHCSLHKLQVSVGQSISDPDLILLVEDLTAWASAGELSTSSIKVKSISSTVQSKKELFLCELAERTAGLASYLGEAFQTLVDRGKKRPRDLLYALAKGQEDHAISHEPSSITRPSYVLRSSLNHVRVHDSWKINSRIRHIYKSLPVDVQDELNVLTKGCSGSSPGDVRRQVIEAFERWRGWELGNIEESHLIESVYDKRQQSFRLGSMPPTTRLVIKMERIYLCVDPGPTEQRALFGGFAAAVSMVHVLQQKNDQTMAADLMERSIVVQGHCGSARLRITWEVLELLEKLMKYFSKQDLGLGKKSEHIYTDNVIESPPRRNRLKLQYQVVLTADYGSLDIETINLKSVCSGHSLRASLVMSGKSLELQEGLIGSILVHADIASSEVSHQNNQVLSVSSIQPVFYAYLDQHCVAETTFNYWKATSSCHDLSFELREEVLGLMEVIDFVVNDEVSYINRLIHDIKKGKPLIAPSSPRSTSHPRRIVNLADISLKLNSFTISAALLPSLIYFFRANGIQLSTRPKNHTETIIDFDLLHHEHEVRTEYQSQPVTISLLQIPAISGRVRSQDSIDESLLELFFSVEEIGFDASAVQSLLNALNKPEVVSVVERARREWSITEARIDQLFGSTKPIKPEQTTEASRLIYRAHVGISGVKIETQAPSANFEINLGAIQVYASNKPNKARRPLDLPDIFLEFEKITATLTKKMPSTSPEPCGHIGLHASLLCSSQVGARGKLIRAFYLKSHSLRADLFVETASTVVDVTGHLQDSLKDLDLSAEVNYLRKLRKSNKPTPFNPTNVPLPQSEDDLFNSIFSLELNDTQVTWVVGNSVPASINRPRQNLILMLRRIGFESAIKKHNEARLIIEELLLHLVDEDCHHIKSRAENSALLPEMVFVVTHSGSVSDRRITSQVKGLPLDLQITPHCMLGVNDLETSLSIASEKFRVALASWKSTPTVGGTERKSIFSKKRLASVLVDADFAGAVVHFQPNSRSYAPALGNVQQGRFGQFAHGDNVGNTGTTTLKTPGLAFKVQYLDPDTDDPSISGEIKVSGSTNIIYPSVVPLLMEMSNSLKDVVRKSKSKNSSEAKSGRNHDGRSTPTGDAAAILGRCKLNLGLRIMKQEFSLSCQPFARVAATATYKDIYVTLSTCEDEENGRFYSISAITTGLRCSLQHIYSRESTGCLEVEALAISVMNNRHLGGSDGLSVIMKFSPVKAQVNVKQLQDFLLFREIWVPVQVLEKTPSPAATPEQPAQFMQRYHKVTATKVFPWNTTLAISNIDLQLDLGSSLGKTGLQMSNFWIASRKSSDWEQTMCLGLESIGIKANGRLSGFIELVNLRARTSIQWLPGQSELTPLIQASIGFQQFRVKASFDYHPFLIADIDTFDFLMYNVRQDDGVSDRLVAVLEGDKVQIFCTSQSTAQGLALYQALLRLWQEKISSYENSLKDIEKYIKRRTLPLSQPSLASPAQTTMPLGLKSEPLSLSLHTNVVVNLRKINIGAFPSTFRDSQVFKVEALDLGARFAVDMQGEKLHSQLGMTLGQLRVALSAVRKSDESGMAAEVKIEDIISNATGSKGGTILNVPRVTAGMHTWRFADSNQIDYTFKSSFEGKVDVGWNYARVSFIKNMWQNHLEAMAAHKSKQFATSSANYLPTPKQPAPITINTTNISPPPPGMEPALSTKDNENFKDKGKITAVVNVPQSRYEYHPLQPPIIETPQLRDMGEATPPLEWIGLNRDKLPNITHQIVIVSLLEIAKEVEDAYHKILGTG